MYAQEVTVQLLNNSYNWQYEPPNRSQIQMSPSQELKTDLQ